MDKQNIYNKMSHYEIVSKLIGNIYPYGDTAIDEERFENLQKMCSLVANLINEIDYVSSFKNRHEHSMKEMGEYAHKFLNEEVGIKNEK